MTHFHDEVRIEAPVDQAWALFLDTSTWAAWMPQRKTLDVSGPLDHVGTTYSQTARLMGVDLQWTNEVVEVEPLRLIHVHSDYGPSDSYYRFVPDGEVSHLVIDSYYEAPDAVPGFLKDLMRTAWMEREVRRVFHELIDHEREEPC